MIVALFFSGPCRGRTAVQYVASIHSKILASEYLAKEETTASAHEAKKSYKNENCKMHPMYKRTKRM